MIKINVISNNIRWKKYIKNPNNFIDKKIKNLNKKNKLYKNNILICSLLLSGTKEIKKLNKKFRNKNVSTDILSFPFYEKKEMMKKLKQEKKIYLGDIIINLNKIKNKNNKFFFKDEFIKVLIHGLAHLLGYRHRKDNEFNEMKKLEKNFYNYTN